MNEIITDNIRENLFRIKKELGILLLEIRQRNGLTQQFVAESINMSYRNINIIENKYKTTLDQVLKLYTFYYSRNYGTVEDESRFRRIIMGEL